MCTQIIMVNLEKNLQKMDVFDHCTRERPNSKWRICKLTIITVFASLLKDKPMGFKATVSPEPLLENHNVKCLTFE